MAATNIPVSGDFENGFGDSPYDVATTVRESVQAGLAGCCIEDSTGRDDEPIYDAGLATERIQAGVEAIGDQPFVLVARSENYLHGRRDLGDTIARLQAFEAAGAHALYAPGLNDLGEIRTVVESIGVPLNVLAGMPGQDFTLRSGRRRGSPRQRRQQLLAGRQQRHDGLRPHPAQRTNPPRGTLWAVIPVLLRGDLGVRTQHGMRPRVARFLRSARSSAPPDPPPLRPVSSVLLRGAVGVDTVARMARSTHQALVDERNATVQIYINGEFFPRDEAKISVFDSGFLVGDGIWEGIRLHHGKFAFLDRHLDRLFAGAAAIALDIGLDRAGVAQALRQTIDRNDMHDDVHARLMITRGDKRTPSQHPSNCVGGPNIVIIAEHKAADPAVRDEGISLFTATVRRPPPDTLDQKLNCHSKLHEVIALIQATTAGADEALMLDPTGAVATCNATNFFIVRDGEVFTATGQYNLNGITSALVVEVAHQAGIAAHQVPFSLTDVYAADEAFVTGTFGGLTPVHTIDGRTVGDGSQGPMTRRLRELYDEAVAAEVAG